jgi:soluble lytic murein transglycosylase
LARREQNRLREKFPEQFGLNSTAAMADEADRLAREGRSQEAEALYRKVLAASAEGEQRLRILSKLAALFESTRARGEAIPIHEQIVREFPDTAQAPASLYRIGQTLWNRHENGPAFEQFRQLIDRYPNSAYMDRAQFASGDIHEYFGRKAEAIQLYNHVIRSYPKSGVRDDAAWRLAWLYYRAEEWSAALGAFRNLVAQSPRGSFAVAATYWQGRTLEKLGDADGARQLYRQLTGSDESYYQALALRSLERLGITVDEPRLARANGGADIDAQVSAEANFHLSRARELSALGYYGQANIELDEVSRFANSKNRLQPLLLREYFTNQSYGRSLALAGQLSLSQGERNFYHYPLAYWELVQQKSRERELDPHLILGLIRQESLFNARARSPANALGLMQLIPPTAARVAKQLGLPAPNQEKLFDPEFNINLGTQYLRDLMQRYGNNWFKAVAAYNAGEAAVDRWEREIVTDDIEEFVERIPYIETRGYVKLVLRNHRIYRRLYEPTR